MKVWFNRLRVTSFPFSGVTWNAQGLFSLKNTCRLLVWPFFDERNVAPPTSKSDFCFVLFSNNYNNKGLLPNLHHSINIWRKNFPRMHFVYVYSNYYWWLVCWWWCFPILSRHGWATLLTSHNHRIRLLWLKSDVPYYFNKQYTTMHALFYVVWVGHNKKHASVLLLALALENCFT